MRIPFPFRRNDTSRAVDDAIERFRRRRMTRPLIGIHVPPSFEYLEGTVCAIRGSGKWIQLNVRSSIRDNLSRALRENCLEAIQAGSDWQATIGTGFDLGDACADLCDGLLARASLSANDLLVVCVDEPGIRWSDYDGRLEYAPLFQPHRFVERTGLNVIDGFAAADVASGGRGGPLSPLALWFLFSDRQQPIARTWRWIIHIDTQCVLIGLPPSDGLDAELPDIRVECLPGLGTLDRLLSRASGEGEAVDAHGSLSVQGRTITEIRKTLVEHTPRVAWQPWVTTHAEVEEWMTTKAESVDKIATRSGIPWPDVWCSATLSITDQIRQVIEQQHSSSIEHTELIVAGRGSGNGLLLSELGKIDCVSEVLNIDHTGIESNALHSTIAAVLGLMHIDQMPASLPWLTGSAIPRLHGRVSAGRPVQWRNLVTEMADYHPPAMKLRDAV